MPVPSNQIKVTFVIILPFNLIQLWFFLFHIAIEGKCGWIIGGGGGGGGGGQRVLNYWGACSPPPSSYAYAILDVVTEKPFSQP